MGVSGKAVLEEILRKFPSLSSPERVNGVKLPKPEISVFDGVPYIIVPDPRVSNDNGRYGLAVKVEGLVNEEADTGCLIDGESHLSVFAEEFDGINLKRGVKPIGHECKGMIYDFDDEKGISKIGDVKDVNMAINAISNYMLDCVDFGFFRIKNYLIEAFEGLASKGLCAGLQFKDIFTKSLVSGIKEFINSYNECSDKSSMPLDAISLKLYDLANLNPNALKDILSNNESLVQGFYNSLLNKGMIFSARNIFAISGIKPDLSDSTIKSIYNRILNRDGVDILEDLFGWHEAQGMMLIEEPYAMAFRKLYEWFGVKPDASMTQSFYNSLLREDYINSAIELFSITGVRPDVSDSVIQSKYELFFSNAWIEGAHNLLNLTGVKPEFTESKVKSWYASILNDGKKIVYGDNLFDWTNIMPDDYLITYDNKWKFERFWLDSLLKWLNINEKPDFSNNAEVQEVYDYLFTNGEIDKAHYFLNYSGIKPEFTDSKVQSWYDSMFMNGNLQINKLSVWSGIKPVFNEQKIQSYYKYMLENGDANGAHYLFKLCRLKPSDSLVQECFDKLVSRGHLDSAFSLKGWTKANTVFNESAIQSAYDAEINNRNFNYIKVINKVTGINPDFSESKVQSYYKNFLSERGDPLVEDAIELFGLSKIKPSEDILQTAFKSNFRNKYLNKSSKLIDAFGVMPKNETIQAAYDELLSFGYVFDANSLYNEIKVMPDLSKLKVQSYYDKFLTSGKIDSVAQLQKWAGIKPDLSASKIQSYYDTIFSSGWVEDARKLMEFTGVKPDFSASIVQSYYNTRFEKLSNVFSFKGLSEWSGINPDCDNSVIQSCYKHFLSNSQFDSAKLLSDWLKINPNEEVIQSSYDSLFGNDKRNDKYKYCDAIKLFNMYQLKPSDELMNKYGIKSINKYQIK